VVDRVIKADTSAEGPEVLQAFGLSETTLNRLEIYAALLRKWQPTINLVSTSTLDRLWSRHIGDSLNVWKAAPGAKIWMDLGSGAGFPGLVTAICLADIAGAHVHLVESDQRKCAFLRDVSRETGAPVTIHVERIEKLLPSFAEAMDAVSARALAPLQTLVLLAEKLLEKGAVGVFPQGETASIALTDSRLLARFDVSEQRTIAPLRSRLAIIRVKSRP
jgi:16S rRNA (guanine527-N7)-methyltransferase